MKKNEMGGAREKYGRERTGLVAKTEGKRLLGRPRHRRQNNTKMDLKQIGLEGMDWIDVAEDRDKWRTDVNTVMNIRAS